MRPLKISSEDAIVEAALELLTRNPGASLSQIALRAGVGRATLHRYFPSRDDLLRGLAIRALDETDAATADAGKPSLGARERLRAVFEAMIPLGSRFHFLRSESAQIHDPVIGKRYRLQLQRLRRLVEQLRDEGELAPDVPDSWAVATIDMLIWVAWTEVAEGNMLPADAVDMACRTVLAGLKETT